jgi:putative two-component system response regulator
MRSLNVLVVEDDEVQRSAMKELLSDEFQVRVARSAAEAIRVMNAAPPDVVLSDLTLGGVDALGMLATMRADLALSAIPVMVVTGSQDLARRQRALELGAVDYLMKPINPEVLAARVRRAFDRGS